MFVGGLYTTRGIEALLNRKQISHEELWECVSRHMNGDYGTFGSDSVKINRSKLNHNCGNVMSQYEINSTRIWIITELGDSETTYTTILLPEEY